MNNIDPGELYLAETGVVSIIEGKTPYMGKGRVDHALALPDRLAVAAGKCIRGELEYTTVPRPSTYKTLFPVMVEGLNDHEIKTLLSDTWPDDSHAGLDWSLAATRAYEVLRGVFPVVTVNHFTGDTQLQPTDDRVWKFYSQLSVIENPTRVLELACAGALLRPQVAVFRDVYPTLSPHIDELVFAAIAKEHAGKKKSRIHARVEAGLCVWLGRPRAR